MIELNKYRIGTGVPMLVRLYDSGVEIAWPDVEIVQLCLYNEQQKAFAGYCIDIHPDAEDDTLLHCFYPAAQQQFVGDYRLIAQVAYNGNPATYDALAFTLVRNFEDAETGTNPEPVEIGITVTAMPSSVITEILAACVRATDASIAQATAAANAEAARVAAENARVAAETARVNAETARVNAERLRGEAEAARVRAENARVAAETARVNAETARVNAERLRGEAEAARVAAENARVAAETARVNAETARVNAERLRGEAEAARVRAENARVAAETARVNAETARVNAERLRGEAEDERKTNEIARQEAETAREQDTANAVQTMTETVGAAIETMTETVGGAVQDLTRTADDLTTGVFGIICDAGDIILLRNAHGSTIQGGEVDADGNVILEIEVSAN